jgi:hypothetical protein
MMARIERYRLLLALAALLVAATGLTIAIAKPTEVVNAVPNPGFESNTTGWYVAAPARLRRVAEARYGAHASQLTGPRFSGMSMQILGLRPHALYTASAWIRAPRRIAPDIALEVRGPENTVSVARTTGAAQQGWQRLVTRFRAGGDGEVFYLRVVSYARRRASLLVDAVQIRPGAQAVAYADATDPGVRVLPRVEGSEAVRGGFGWPTAEWLQVVLVALTASILVYTLVRTIRRRDFLVEPVLWLAAALLVMFVIRPVAMLGHSGMILHGTLDVSPGFTGALVAGLVGTVALLLGYAWRAPVHAAERLPPQTKRFSDRTWAIAALVMLGIAALGSALYLHLTGHAVWSSFGGTESNSASSTAYLYLAPYCAMPAALILFGLAWTRRSRWLFGATGALVAVMFYSYLHSGDRLWALLLLFALTMYALLRSGRRPRRWKVAVAALVAFVVITPLRDLTPHSSAGDLARAIAHPWVHPDSEWHRFATQADTEMVAAIAAEMQIVPGVHGFHPGNSIVTLLARPVPHLLWAGKPRSSDQVLNHDLFGAIGYHLGDAGVAYSAVGDFYYDTGFVGIVIGMFLIGAAFRLAWEYWRRNQNSEWARLVYALLLPFTVIVLRGNVQDSGTRALFVVVPAALVPAGAVLVRRRRSGPKSRPADKLAAEEIRYS